ncbi:ATP-binding protein [Salinibius halmophilus]|uniref:ATP-binding protein n=1 Tax=Salinibius halmophilus TaxID=1853216 RepID=UPI000E663B00|nr:ATP-binding protein [Salinibius halmophilus]
MSNLDQLFASGQIRLAQLSVYNWGSFSGLHTANIDAQGTLVTGDNGAGKSTFVDGLMALLLPPGKASFNIAAAQGDKSDRNLLSYMRGSFGSVHDGGSATRIRSKREGSVVTGLRAMYQAEDGSKMTLAALFWVKQTGKGLSDVERLYVLGKRDLKLTELLEPFDGGNVRALKAHVKQQPLLEGFDGNHSAFSDAFRKLMHMDNRNAPNLLARALGLKKIDDLTSLIRELVLEPSDIRDKAQKAVLEFADLDSTHQKLLDARNQAEALSALPEQASLRQTAIAEQTSTQAQKEALPIVAARQQASIVQAQVNELEQQLSETTQQLASNKQQKTAEQQRSQRLHNDYMQLGGDRIEQAKRDLAHAQQEFGQTSANAQTYQTLAKLVGQNDELTRQAFEQLQARQQTAQQQIEQREQQLQDELMHAGKELGNANDALVALNEEISQIKARPDSNVPANYQTMRENLCDALGLNKSDCPFIAELIDVHDKPWQGAIERSLGGLRTTLLLPQASYREATRWLNEHHTGVFVRAQVVNLGASQPVEFLAGGILRKLNWQQHPYRDWLKQHLAKFDLTCVDSVETLNKTEYSITLAGLIHKERGRFEKKDQQKVGDRRHWLLGFNNKQRLAALESEASDISEQVSHWGARRQQLLAEQKQLNKQQNAWQRLVEFSWPQIDVSHWQQAISTIEADLARLQAQSGEIEKAKQAYEDSLATIEQLEQTLSALDKRQGGLEAQLAERQNKLSTLNQLAKLALAQDIAEQVNKQLGQQTELAKAEAKQTALQQQYEQQLNRLQKQIGTAVSTIVGIISKFRGNPEWAPLTVDWGTGLDGLDDYIGHYQSLVDEGLPELVEQFKERLNKHTGQSLAHLQGSLHDEREHIADRIEQINQVLARTEFRAGSSLRLKWDNENYVHVREFDQQLKQALSAKGSDADPEVQFKHIAQVISTLAKACDPSTAKTKHSLRLLEPSYRMAFYAEEYRHEDGETIDVLKSSSGKSGGEKESFAGTIVAAALAYVLTPDGYHKPIYSTVFLDEAFSNTAESVSRRVLKVFKALNIHVNLITPYKNLNLARESARSLIIAERDAEQHESRLLEITWQELDEQRAAQAQATLNAALEAE